MPDISIEQSTFERLQRHARPLVDTTDTVVNRALDALENHGKGVASLGENSSTSEHLVDPLNLPNLTHTKVLDASLDGQRVTKANWNLLLDKLLIRAMKQLRDLDELHRLFRVNMVQGCKEDEGYRHIAEINVWVQRLSANNACGALVIAAQRLRLELQVDFMWRDREGAACPGEKARLHIPATHSGSRAKTA